MVDSRGQEERKGESEFNRTLSPGAGASIGSGRRLGSSRIPSVQLSGFGQSLPCEFNGVVSEWLSMSSAAQTTEPGGELETGLNSDRANRE